MDAGAGPGGYVGQAAASHEQLDRPQAACAARTGIGFVVSPLTLYPFRPCHAAGHLNSSSSSARPFLGPLQHSSRRLSTLGPLALRDLQDPIRQGSQGLGHPPEPHLTAPQVDHGAFPHTLASQALQASLALPHPSCHRLGPLQCMGAPLGLGRRGMQVSPGHHHTQGCVTAAVYNVVTVAPVSSCSSSSNTNTRNAGAGSDDWWPALIVNSKALYVHHPHKPHCEVPVLHHLCSCWRCRPHHPLGCRPHPSQGRPHHFGDPHQLASLAHLAHPGLAFWDLVHLASLAYLGHRLGHPLWVLAHPQQQQQQGQVRQQQAQQ